MTEHKLKIWPEHFIGIQEGYKPFEVRRDDRGYRVGDILVLQEWDRFNDRYTGREMRKVVTCKLDGGQFGIEPGFCVLGLPWPEPHVRED